MVLPSFKAYVNDNFASQSDAARSLRLSVQQFSRLVNEATPIGWNLVGRVWYFWKHQKNLPDVDTILSSIGAHIDQRDKGKAQ